MKKILAVAVSALIATSAFANDIIGYEIVRVIKVDPIGSMKAYSAPRISCDTTETVNTEQQIIQQQKCITYSDREYRYNIKAFNVTFEYRGTIRTVKMDYDPGNAIRIKTVTKIYAVE